VLTLGTLTFLWPRLLWGLAALPVLLALYAALVRRRRRAAARFPALDRVGGGTARGGALRRMLPPLLWFAALALLAVALARPQAALTLPARLDTIVLAIDMSGSMRATDIAPDRATAARNAARSFVAEQPSRIKVGVVAIAGAAAVVQSPTDNRADIAQAIDRLEPQRGTALGTGLVIALDTALPRAGIDVEKFINAKPGDAAQPAPTEAEPTRDHAAAAIVLLSDGQSNVGPDPMKAADIAARHGVRIYTVGLGTTEGTVVKAEGWSMRVRLDEDTLKKIAQATDGEYFRAADAAQLKQVYDALGSTIGFERQRPTEVTALFTAAAALLAIAGALLSLRWFDRIL
jgi:Ca-activated chloride channel family protein